MAVGKALTGAAGVYFVAGELSRRGYIALPTSRNTKGIDIVVTNPDANKSAHLQVKTKIYKHLHWPMGKNPERQVANNFFYVFVDLANVYPNFYVVPSRIVAKYIREDYKLWLSTPGRRGQRHREGSIRIFPGRFKVINLKQFENRWDLLKLE